MVCRKNAVIKVHVKLFNLPFTGSMSCRVLAHNLTTRTNGRKKIEACTKNRNNIALSTLAIAPLPPFRKTMSHWSPDLGSTHFTRSGALLRVNTISTLSPHSFSHARASCSRSFCSPPSEISALRGSSIKAPDGTSAKSRSLVASASPAPLEPTRYISNFPSKVASTIECIAEVKIARCDVSASLISSLQNVAWSPTSSTLAVALCTA
mmetsp:Transcript_69276/g.109421  ORF Transcript_69276/g.109421 Transcript_69276/m.109421 type:complete len:208 (-) Transcript_69276:765-1388(-)